MKRMTTLQNSNISSADKHWTLVHHNSKHVFKLSKHLPNLPPFQPNIIAKGDSGASNHYFALCDADVLDDCVDTHTPTTVTLPNLDILKSTKTGHLPFPISLKMAKKLIFSLNLTTVSFLLANSVMTDALSL